MTIRVLIFMAWKVPQIYIPEAFLFSNRPSSLKLGKKGRVEMA
jgi:hypothetical protein